jgi:hypothetical protein
MMETNKIKVESRTSPESAFERFQGLIRGLVSVPKKEVEAEEVRWRANRRSKKKSVDA